MFSLELPQLSILKKKNTLKYPKFAAMGFFFRGTQNEFEIALVNEPSGFEPLKFYCIMLETSFETNYMQGSTGSSCPSQIL